MEHFKQNGIKMQQIGIKKEFKTFKYMDAFFSNMNDSIIITSKTKQIIYSNQALNKQLGWSPNELLGVEYIIFLNHYLNLESSIDIKEFTETATKITRKNGSTLDVILTITPVHNSIGELEGIITQIKDISKLKSYENQLEKMAFFDELTRIPNRRLFNDRLSQAFLGTKRKNTKLAIMYLDCDEFKWINDTYGHETGDFFLVEVVKRVQRCLRESDTFARLGGDEFAIIIDDFKSINEITLIAERIIEAFAKPIVTDELEYSTSVSIGISVFPGDGTDIDCLLSRADQALYLAKEKGKNTYQFYTTELANYFTRQEALEDGLRSAIEEGHLYLVFQPQFNIQTNQMIGVEVLLRYDHPKLGIISPTEFIPICERIGIIDDITFWVIKESLKVQKQWDLSGYGVVPIAINISPSTLGKQIFLTKLKQYLKDFKTNPTTLEFELVEYKMLENIIEIKEILEHIKELGIKVSIDDFGTGYSSLMYLKDLPFDKVKIDRSFIKEILVNEKDQVIMEIIFSLSKKLDFDVLCEGVETKEQVSYLLTMGCRLVQGFYYSKPLPKEDLEQMWFYNPYSSLVHLRR